MNSEEYKALSRMRRFAIFLLVIGPEQAAPLVKSLDEKQRKEIVHEFTEIDVIEDSLQQMVLQEFSEFLAEELTALRGGKDSALAFFESALGSEEADKIASELGPPKVVQEIQARFRGMKAEQIWSALSEEDNQVLAYVLSTVDSRKAAEILSLIEGNEESGNTGKVKDIFLRMSRMEATPSDLLPRVVGNLMSSVPKESTRERVSLGGHSRSADVLKALPRDKSNELLSAVEEEDEQLGRAISKEMFSFKDLVDLSSDAMQRVMREVDSALLTVAMKSAAPELTEKIYSSLSKRGAEALKEEIEMQGSLKLAEVEAAQDAVLDIVRKLEADGEISLGGEDEAYV